MKIIVGYFFQTIFNFPCGVAVQCLQDWKIKGFARTNFREISGFKVIQNFLTFLRTHVRLIPLSEYRCCTRHFVMLWDPMQTRRACTKAALLLKKSKIVWYIYKTNVNDLRIGCFFLFSCKRVDRSTFGMKFRAPLKKYAHNHAFIIRFLSIFIFNLPAHCFMEALVITKITYHFEIKVNFRITRDWC